MLARLIPLAAKTAAVEPHVGLARVVRKRLGDTSPWLLRPRRRRRSTICWKFRCAGNWAIRRRRGPHLRLPRREIFYHDGPFLKRSDVSIEAEFAAPSDCRRRKFRHARRTELLDVIVDASAVRYRELYGFHASRPATSITPISAAAWICTSFGVRRERRLPVRDYHCGMFFKNGVPDRLRGEACRCSSDMEVGFNLYYTFREGETAWLYARILKLLHERWRRHCFSVDPYQLGHENEEAIESGAFWFYRKLGFRPAAQEVARLAEREQAKAAARPGYRTPPAILRRLAAAPLFYGGNGSDWDGFSLHGLGSTVPNLGEDVARAKRAAEETRYLRLLQRRPDLRRRLLRKAGWRRRRPAPLAGS